MEILAIGAHPDDIEYGCGGTLLKYAQKKHHIHLLILTKGKIGGDPEIRQKEQEASAKILGAKVYWGGFADTEIPIGKELIMCIENVIYKVKPDLILAHYFYDTHQDHFRASRATTTATRYMRNVLFYEVPTTYDFTPSVFVDIGDVLEKKVKLLKAHHSQVFETRVAGLSILDSAKACVTFRGFQDRVKYAEGFMPLRYTISFGKEE